MEFFNYDYCIKLNKQNELDKLNISINDIKKDIETKKLNIKNILESYIKYNCLIKLKLLNLKHIIIKLILNLYNTKKLINDNSTKLNNINNEIDKLKSTQYNLLLYKLNETKYDQNEYIYKNKLNHIICKLLNKNNVLDNNTEIFTNINDYINNNNVTSYTNIIQNIVIKLSKLVYKKNKKLYFILNTYLNDNIFNKQHINDILYKILNLNKLFNLNKNIIEFFKIKTNNNNNIKSLYNDKKTLLKNNKINNNNELKLHKNVNSKIKLYNKLYKSIYKKYNNICTTINKYEKNIIKLTNLLDIFNNKFLTLNNEIEDISLINCPNELIQKCIEFDNTNYTCCICLDIITTGIKTSCNHIFHIYCINLYIYSIINNEFNNINIICPLCRNYI